MTASPVADPADEVQLDGPRVLTQAGRLVIALASVAVLAMMALTVVDVALRYAVNAPITGMAEYVVYLCMVPITFLGVWWAEVRGEHFYVSALSDRLPPGPRTAIEISSRLVTACFVAVLSYYGLVVALDRMALGQTAQVSGLPLWPLRFVVVACLVAYAAHLVVSAAGLAPRTSVGEEAAGASPCR